MKNKELKVNPFKENELIDLKSAFGIDNAKQMDVKETVEFFVPQKNFDRLLIKKNQILLGSRGSGKTTWVRMLAHDHLFYASSIKNQRTDYARRALEKNLIGVYVPASAAFTGDLKNKSWQNELEAENYFVWRLNLHVCSALTHIIESCVSQYSNECNSRRNEELIQKICLLLGAAWSDGKEGAESVDGLRLLLTSIELRHQKELRIRRMSSVNINPYEDHFDTDLMLPFKNSINIIKTVINIPKDAVWMICLDEIEYLSELHHRILNSQIRSASSDLIFKMATMPFAHHTLSTNFGDPVREGNDFEYINVDQESIDRRGGHVEGDFLLFAREMFKRRIASKGKHLNSLDLKSLLGPSKLIDTKRVNQESDIENIFYLLKRHANPATIARAERLRGNPKFKDEIIRKMHGALLLREALSNNVGNSKIGIYSGESLVVRCADGNARRLMRIINLLIQKIELDEKGMPKLPIDSAVQNQILNSVARDTINRVQSEPPNGVIVKEYLSKIGEYFKWKFTSSKSLLGSDQYTSVKIDSVDGEDAQKFIKQAVQLSLMIPGPDITFKTSESECTGVFHLAFLFAPYFNLLPRRNNSLRLSKALSHSKNFFEEDGQQQLL